VPSSRIGVASKTLLPRVRLPSATSPVWKLQASSSRPTFSRVICVSGEWRVPPRSPPQTGQPATGPESSTGGGLAARPRVRAAAREEEPEAARIHSGPPAGGVAGLALATRAAPPSGSRRSTFGIPPSICQAGEFEFEVQTRPWASKVISRV